MTQRVEVSHKTIFSTLAILALVWFVIQIREIILLLFISLILVSALRSPVDWLTRKRIPRPLAIFLCYLLILAIFGGGVASLIPPFLEQTKTLLTNLPFFLEEINKFLLYQLPTRDLLGSIGGGFNFFSENIFKYTLDFFGNVVTLVTLFVFTFYLLLRWDHWVKVFGAGLGHEERVAYLLGRIESGLGNWVRGELLLMLIIGLLSYLGLTLLGIPYALPLAIFAGLLEIIPIVGPIISAIPAIIVTVAVSPILSLATIALYFLIQQLENNLIVPKVMEKAVGLDPLVTILALMVGAKLMGVLGALLAIPFVLLAKIVVLDFYQTGARR